MQYSDSKNAHKNRVKETQQMQQKYPQLHLLQIGVGQLDNISVVKQ